MKNNKKTVFVLTAFGIMIDSICEIHDTYESARNAIVNYVKYANAYEEVICGDIWKTTSVGDDVVEWQIWKKEI